MDDPHVLVALVCVAIVCVAVAFVVLGLVLARHARSRESRARNRVAQEGERIAEAILARAGYRVVERQATASWSIVVDGETLPIDVRADLIVSRRGRRYVAEVKTGARAPDLRHPPTRRQLLEYALVFGADEVLLVDVPEGVVHAVAFPLV